MKEDRKTYEDGLAEAWNLAKKMFLYPHEGGYSSTELEEIFGRTEHLWELSPQEAAAKIAEWEDRYEFRKGDQVKHDDGVLGVIMKVKQSKNPYYVWWGDGRTSHETKESITKTGRTIYIEGLLAQIGGAE